MVKRFTRRHGLVGATAGAAGLAVGASANASEEASRHEEIDVVIVGGGWAGSQLASQLADGDRRRVVVLETGPPWKVQDLVSSMTWARRLKDVPAAERVGRNPLGVANSGWGYGGAALHHFAIWLRQHPEDFEMRTRFGRSMDWPIDYNDLRPFYDRVQETIGISGETRGEIWRPPAAPYPMPPLPETAQGPILRRGFERLDMRVSSVPRAINSIPRDGRPPCELDAWCEAGCAVGALAHPLVTTIPTARRRGAEFRPWARVSHVLTEGDRATGVEYVDRDGRRHVQPAKVVVIAAFVVENARILLASAEAGLANSSGLLGRYLAAHTTGTVYALFEEDTEPGRGWPAGQLLNQDNYAKDRDKDYLASYTWTAGISLKPNDRGGIAFTRPELTGEALDRFMRRARSHISGMTFYGESIHERDNRITLTDERDQHGIQRPRVEHSFGRDALRAWDVAIAEGKRVMGAAGAQETWASSAPGTPHLYGSTIMGDDADTSVTNSYGQTHDVENVFVAGSSLFPTNSGVNPTFTLAAVALRTGDYMLDRWSDLT